MEEFKSSFVGTNKPHGTMDSFSEETDIYRIDLSELATVLGCVSADEVARLLTKDAQQSVAVIADAGDNVGMKVMPANPLFDTPPSTRVALVDAVHHKGELDVGGRPRELRTLDEEKEMTVIRLILFNLYLSGIQTAYILSGEDEAKELSDHITGTEIERLLDVNFVSVDKEYKFMQKGCALVEMSEVCSGQQVLYCSSAVLAEPSLVYEVADFDLEEAAACILVDMNGKKAVKDPLFIEVSGNKVVNLAKGNMQDSTSVAAGLYKLGTEFFDQIQRLKMLGKEYSHVNCLKDLCTQGKVCQIDAQGRRWQPVRTKKQLEKVKEELSSSIKSKDPSLQFPVHLLSTPMPGASEVEHALVLGIPGEEKQIGLAVTVPEESAIRFDMIPAPSVLPDKMGSGSGIVEQGHIPLQQEDSVVRRRSRSRSGGRWSLSSFGSKENKNSLTEIIGVPLEGKLQQVDEEGDFLVTLPEIQELDDINKNEGFLIPLPTTESSEPPNYVLAAPRIEDSEGSSLLSCRCQTDVVPVYLPSDIEEIKVQTLVEVEEEEMIKEPALQVVITRKVPLIGWLILPVVLISSASTGPFERYLTAPVLLTNFWRKSLSTVLMLPLALRAFLVPEVRQKMFKAGVLKNLFLSVFGMCLCNTTYYVALMYLAVPIVGLFENTTPVLLLGLKLIKKEHVSLMEGVGAIVALTGTAIVGIDATSNTSTSSGGNFLVGSALSLACCIGLAIYLVYAKTTRPHVDIFILNFLMCIFTMLSSLATQYFFFPDTLKPLDIVPTSNIAGTLFGYLLVPSLFALQVGISLCSDVVSITGALAVMKYFDALFLSISFLSTPIICMVFDLVLGISGLPDATTLFGCGLVMIGCGIVIKASSGQKTETIDTSKPFKTPAGKNLLKSPNLQMERMKQSGNEITPANKTPITKYDSV